MKDEDYFGLFKQSNEIRNSIIQNIDSQVNVHRQVWISLYSITIGSNFLINNSYCFLIAALVSFLFWIAEGITKSNQRTYIFVNNQIQKLFISTPKEKHSEIVMSFFADLNGYYTFGNKSHNEYKKYHRQTSFIHTLFMKNVCSLYISTIIFPLILCFVIH